MNSASEPINIDFAPWPHSRSRTPIIYKYSDSGGCVMKRLVFQIGATLGICEAIPAVIRLSNTLTPVTIGTGANFWTVIGNDVSLL